MLRFADASATRAYSSAITLIFVIFAPLSGAAPLPLLIISTLDMPLWRMPCLC